MNIEAACSIFNALNPEVWLITAQAGRRRSGLIATHVSAASIVPTLPRVSLGLAKHHLTHELVQASGAFGMHLIGEEHIEWVWRFGIQSGRQLDKLHGLESCNGSGGSPMLTDALAWLDCRVESQMDTGDRTIFLAEVLNAKLNQDTAPLTIKRLIELAPPEKLHDLKLAMEHDIPLDHEAILAWRHQHETAPSPTCAPGGRTSEPTIARTADCNPRHTGPVD